MDSTARSCARWSTRCATSGRPRWWCWQVAEDSNVSIVGGVTKDLTAKVHAGKLVGAVAQAVGGKGGGRPDMAEAGGKDPSALRRLWPTFIRVSRGCCSRGKETTSFDVVIVGAGPTGLACGIELKKRGVSAVLIDKGCVVNSLYHYPTNMVFFTTPELLEIGDIPMTSLNEKPVRGEALKYYRRVADHYKLDIRQYERVENITGEDGAFVTHAVDAHGCARQYASKKVILSMGYYDVPNILNVPGEDLPKVIHYYKEAHPYYNSDVLVVGAKNSAAIAALELWWTGARVTLVHRGEGIHNNVKYWIKPNIENRIKNGEIPAYFRSTVLEIGETSCALNSRRRKAAEERFCVCDDRLSSGPRVSGRTRHPFRSGNRAPVHASGDAGERPQRHVSGGRAGGGDAHQRDFYRERPVSRSKIAEAIAGELLK